MASLGYGAWSKHPCFGLLIFLALLALVPAARGRRGKALWWMIILAFTLRLTVGIATFFALPVDVTMMPMTALVLFSQTHIMRYTGWRLADIDKIFGRRLIKISYDQYGGLLAFSAVVYRYLQLIFIVRCCSF